MYSSEDLERFYFQYKTQGVPLGISIEKFCINNKVPYNIFSKWYRDTRKKIIEVEVTGRPADSACQPSTVPQALPEVTTPATSMQICVELQLSNGLHLSQKNLSYQGLVHMIEKLEGLC